MRHLFLVAALAALTPTAANAAAWIATCRGQDTQYMQDIGGVGFFHQGLGDGTYETQRLIQTYYDGNVVCASADPKAPETSDHIGQICADKTKKAITVLYKNQMSPGASARNAQVYCSANVKVH